MNRKIIIMVLASILVTLQLGVNAQKFNRGQRDADNRPRQDMQKMNKGQMDATCLPGLTDEQKEKAKTFKVEFLKKITPYQDQIAEKRAHVRSLSNQENPEMDKINSTIDEISDLRAEIMKAKAAHHQDIRNILTEEQRILFDSKRHHRSHQKGGCMSGKARVNPSVWP